MVNVDYVSTRIHSDFHLHLRSQRRAMRWLALIVGAGVLAVLAWWHGGLSHAIGAPFSGNARCDEPFCEAVQSLASTILRPPLPLGIDGRLPPPDVRGSIDARITQGNIGRTICRPGYSRSMRPSYGVTGPLKRRMMRRNIQTDDWPTMSLITSFRFL